MANIIFNCDSTLVGIEGPDELARRKGVSGIAELTERAMNGDESFADVFRRRFELLAPTLADTQWLGERYIASVVPDAKDVVATLQAEGHYVFIVSASYRPAILKLARHLGIPSLNICAVDLDFGPNGDYRGYDTDNILTSDAGIQIASAEIAKLGYTIYVGDSIRDLDALPSVDAFIGFGGVRLRPAVEAEADLYITQNTLSPVVDFVRNRDQSVTRRRISLETPVVEEV